MHFLGSKPVMFIIPLVVGVVVGIVAPVEVLLVVVIVSIFLVREHVFKCL